MKLDILNLKGEKIKDYTLDKEVFGIEVNEKVLKDAIIVAECSLRQGTHKTKTRAEVRGGGRKPWRQKGTGNARQGSIRAVQWVGGGIAFGPVPRDYSKKQNKKERRLALKSAYTIRANNNDIIAVESLKLTTPKTKEMKEVLTALNLMDKKVLMVVKEYDENLILASRNLQNVAIVLPSEISVLDIIGSNKILAEQEALEEIKEALK